MKRSLLPASALVLVVTACGAGAKPAPRVTEVRARVPSVRVLVGERKRAAASEARRLLRRFVPPPGALSAHEPRGCGGVLRRTGPTPAGEVVDVHRFWSVRKPLTAVAAFVRTHKPHGFAGGSAGVLQGTRSYVLQDADGNVELTHSISAGLDYASVGPEHAWLRERGRAEYTWIDDADALAAFQRLGREEGILPALESSHAIAHAARLAPSMPKDAILLVNLSGRGDKDVLSVQAALEKGQ